MRNNSLDMSDRNQHCPLLAVRGHQLSLLKVRFSGGFVQTTLHCVGQASFQMADLDISLFVWICI